MEVEKEQHQLPPRDDVPSFSGAKETTVLANMFNISVKERLRVYKYHIDIRKIIASKGKEVDLTKGPKNDYATQARRRVLNSLWYDLIEFTEEKGTPLVTEKYNNVYDCGNIVYSSTPLISEGSGDAKLQFKMPMDDVTSNNSKRFLGNACSEIVYTLTPTIYFDFSLTGNQAKETLQFLEILTSALLVKRAQHFVFKNKFYGKDTKNDVTSRNKKDSGKVIKSGFVKNCRIGELDGRAVALLQMDAKMSPFFVGSKVMDFATKFFEMRDPRDLERLSGNDIRDLINQLKGVVVRTTHTEKSKCRTFAIHSVSTMCAEQIKFEHEGSLIYMDEYFESRYNAPIKYRNIPVIEERLSRGNSYYPMEFLEIVEGQRVTNQTPSAEILAECRMIPEEMRRCVDVAMQKCLLDSDNPFLNAFGLRVRPQWQLAPATVLHPPNIVYSNTEVKCGADGFLNWKLGRQQFIRGGKINKFMFIIFDECANDKDVDRFIDAIARTASDFGVRLDEREISIEDCRSESDSQLKKLFDKMKKADFPFIMGLTKGDKDAVHGALKKLEASTGVVTQHIASATFRKAIGNKGAFMVLNNLVLKMNLKAQGINHDLELSAPFMKANKGTAPQDQNERLLPKYRMFIGLDVSHAGAQSFSDRQLGSDSSSPSVVGMSYTVSSPTEMKGTYWLQEPRLARISQLELNVAKALSEYRKMMGRLPDDIVIYRGGVSEGEYDAVVNEVEDVRKGFALVESGDDFNPTVQCIIVQTNSNYRLIPERGGSKDNVRPGTVVDNVITNPMHNEFVLVAQKGIMGTVRPIKCVIAYNKKGSTGALLNFEDIKLLTNLLCYGHQVVAGCTTLPCLLTAATNLSKRGRSNWNNLSNDDRRSDDEDFSELSKAIESKKNHHFWA